MASVAKRFLRPYGRRPRSARLSAQKEFKTVPASAPRLGAFCAISSPFQRDLTLDHLRLVKHTADLLSRGCDGIAVFGTTGEGASVGLPARDQTFAALADAGIGLRRHVVCGVIASAAEDALALSRQALDRDCRALLLAPPHYYKGIGDDGLFAWFAQLIESLGAAARDIILYHIPGLTAIPLTPALIERLKRSFPGVIIGVKDSSGDWRQTERYLQAHSDLAILVGDERHLARAMTMGGAGTICGVANVVPEAIAQMVQAGRDDERVSGLVDAIVTVPTMAAIKALVAYCTDDPEWRRMRPPLLALDAAHSAVLCHRFDQLFTPMPARV
jgi:4-hydroxy-tetrahydrodipicolinate synthase